MRFLCSHRQKGARAARQMTCSCSREQCAAPGSNNTAPQALQYTQYRQQLAAAAIPAMHSASTEGQSISYHAKGLHRRQQPAAAAAAADAAEDRQDGAAGCSNRRQRAAISRVSLRPCRQSPVCHNQPPRATKRYNRGSSDYSFGDYKASRSAWFHSGIGRRRLGISTGPTTTKTCRVFQPLQTISVQQLLLTLNLATPVTVYLSTLVYWFPIEADHYFLCLLGRCTFSLGSRAVVSSTSRRSHLGRSSVSAFSSSMCRRCLSASDSSVMQLQHCLQLFHCMLVCLNP
jgi:hypothetical protein